MHSRFCTIIFSAFFAACLVSDCFAEDPLYTSPSPSGKSTMYSSKAKSSGDSKPASLPSIVRTDNTGKALVRQTCRTHGGIDCAAGTDKDGSVICYDKYKDTDERFNFNCTAPKLEISKISDAERPATFKVLIRNSASVDAQGVKVEFKPEIGGNFRLVGPDTIKGFQAAEYLYKPSDEFHKFGPPDRSVLRVTCPNCP